MHTLLRAFFVYLSLIAACFLSPGGSAAYASSPAREWTTPQPRLETQQLALTRDGEELHRFVVEIARTAEEKERGLMFRTGLAADGGMLFLYDQDALRYMWMKNTLIPLDMLFLDKDGKILYIQPNAVPHSLEPIGIPVPLRSVLELPGGASEAKDIRLNDVFLPIAPELTVKEP